MLHNSWLPTVLFVASSSLLACASHPTGEPATSSETLPPLPDADGECVIRSKPASGAMFFKRYRFNEAARTLTSETSAEESFAGAQALMKTFDANGALVREGEDGTGQAWSRSYTTDQHGNMTVEVYVFNGMAPKKTVYANAYDAAGRLVTVDLVSSEEGAPPSHTTYTYDAKGRLATESYDRKSDGSIELRLTYEYDGSDRRVKVTRDGSIHSMADGTRLAHWTYTYDDNGRLVTEERDGGGFWDEPADGRPDIRKTWVYDANGHLMTFSVDGTDETDAPVVDGIPDVVDTFAASCDALTKSFPEIAQFPY